MAFEVLNDSKHALIVIVYRSNGRNANVERCAVMGQKLEISNKDIVLTANKFDELNLD